MIIRNLFALVFLFLWGISLYSQRVCDVAITEIMADPTPQVGLPEAEYIEIYNRSNHSVSLTDWHLIVGTHEMLLPKAEIAAYQYAIICAEDNISLFEPFGTAIGVEQQWAALVNTGGVLALTDRNDELVYAVKYSDKMYNSSSKSKGGWSLEMIDCSNPYRGDDNWTASISSLGGTPASKNSVATNLSNTLFRGIVTAYIDKEQTINLVFSEAAFGLTADNILINGIQPISVTLGDILRCSYKIKMPFSLLPHENYTIHLSPNVTNFVGNSAERHSITIALPQKVERGDILFNELLFDPYEGETTFIEFYNNSDKAIDISQLKLASITSSGNITAAKSIYDKPYILLPQTYLAITTSTQSLIDHYRTIEQENILQTVSFPSISKQQGSLRLLDNKDNLIDAISYSYKMHYTLLSETTGISLEKSNPAGSSDNLSLWHSALSSVGYATPGVVNSVCNNPISSVENSISFSSENLSPNGDGKDDMLKIAITNSSIDNMVSISVYSEIGRKIKTIVENATVGYNSTFYWDCTNNNGARVRNGAYIVFIDSFSGNGNMQQIKKVCIVMAN